MNDVVVEVDEDETIVDNDQEVDTKSDFLFV